MPVTLPANALTTLETLADELGIDLDGVVDKRLARLIGVGSDFIERWCGRKFGKLERTELYKGFGMPRLWLATPPLDVDEDLVVKLDDQELDAGDYRVEDAQLGTLWRDGGWTKTAPVVGGASYEALDGMEAARWSVKYTGGYVLPKDDGTGTPALVRTLPYDIEQVCIELIVAKQAARGRDPRVTSERLLSWSATYGESDVTESMRAVLAAYKVVI